MNRNPPLCTAAAGNGSMGDGTAGDAKKKYGLRTRLVHSEAFSDDPYAASMPPIYQTATFGQPGAVEMGEYDYNRSGNPTRTVLERQMADLEVRVSE
jgi:cysteine-S-conjugate beta-lyase